MQPSLNPKRPKYPPETQAAPEVSSLAPALSAETKGIRTLISGPPVCFDVIDIVPFTRLARSRMLMRPKILAHHDRLGIKTYPIIMNCELDLSQCPVESHLEMLHTAVLDRIVQRFP